MARKLTGLEANLYDALHTLFSKEEIANVCFELNFDSEDLDSASKQRMAHDLVALAASAGRANQLARLILRERPNARVFQAWSADDARGKPKLYSAEVWDDPTVG